MTAATAAADDALSMGERTRAAVDGLPDEVRTLIDAAWVWGRDCEVDGLDRAAIGDSHNEGQRDDVLRAGRALEARLADLHGQAEVSRLRRALRAVADAESRSSMRAIARAALRAPPDTGLG